MILTYIDKHNKLPVKLDLDTIRYITYNGENNRAIAYGSNGFTAFYQTLSDLLLEFIKNKAPGYAYLITSQNLHYLVNTTKIIEYSAKNNQTYITFDNQVYLLIDNTQAFNLISKAINLGYENTESQSFHSSSPSDS